MSYMPYTTNPHMPKVRRDAVNLVKHRMWSVRKVAAKFGVEPSTISRWCKKDYCGGFRLIPTESSRPLTNRNALSKEIVSAIIRKRVGRRRCGQHIYHELRREGIVVSLSSVHRTLDRCGLLKKRSLWKRPHDATPRPEVTHSGALMQLDTVHILIPDGSRIYVYTIIDLHSRWAYAEVVPRISAERSVRFVRRAQRTAPFDFDMIQTDHGPEFSTWFTHGLLARKLDHRHSRVRQANDNAHIERFNRTIQEECLDRTAHTISDFKKALKSYLPYYNNERIHMGINYKTPQEVLRSS
jgi:transposase InsO family protein